ncbi:MAG TPA: PP2C family serine/threonine-protein phosphatase [Bellilinea sp.]|nr:PP2C family serine/threonine-protein phosphatase [Bellilinea sp.]
MKRVHRSHLPVLAQTHAGMRGKNNEDRYGVTAFRMEDANRTPALLAVLCDGIGGHRAGEVAAEIAVNRISAAVAEFGESKDPTEVLQNAVVSASQAIYEQAKSNHHQEGMGATCACAFIINRRLYLTNVGDSRAYLLRGGVIQQLTTDHTWIQEALEKGVLTPEQAEGHPNMHVIRRFLGSPQPPEADLRLHLAEGENDQTARSNQGLQLKDGDLLLLCSDGLTDLVADDEIAESLIHQPLQDATDGLVQLANARGGHDNITLITIQVPRGPKEKSRMPAAWLLIGVAVMLIVGLAAGVWASGLLDPRPLATTAPSPTVHVTLQLPGSLVTQPSPQPFATNTFPPLPTAVLTPSVTAPVAAVATFTPWPTNTRSP